MTRQIKVSTGAWQKDLKMVITVIDEDKFKNQCKKINTFFGDAEYRKNKYGSHEKAGFSIFCTECFQQIAFNNFKDEEWLTRQFDWLQGLGIEGFPDLNSFGIKIDEIESWFFDASEIKMTNWLE